jgi:hypothetical protein
VIRRIPLPAALFLAQPAAAHGSDPDDSLLGQFSAGLQLPFSDARLVVTLLVLALALALRGPEDLRRRLLPILAVTCVGVAAAPLASPGTATTMLVIALMLSGLIAAWPSQPDNLRMTLALSGAFLTSAASLQGQSYGDFGPGVPLGLVFAVMLGIAVPALAAANLSDGFAGPIPKLSLRIAASWLAAIAALMLALEFV